MENSPPRLLYQPTKLRWQHILLFALGIIWKLKEKALQYLIAYSVVNIVWLIFPSMRHHNDENHESELDVLADVYK